MAAGDSSPSRDSRRGGGLFTARYSAGVEANTSGWRGERRRQGRITRQREQESCHQQIATASVGDTAMPTIWPCMKPKKVKTAPASAKAPASTEFLLDHDWPRYGGAARSGWRHRAKLRSPDRARPRSQLVMQFAAAVPATRASAPSHQRFGTRPTIYSAGAKNDDGAYRLRVVWNACAPIDV